MKSSQDQRNAIEELYKSGSISKEEYDEMIRIASTNSDSASFPDKNKNDSRFKFKAINKSLIGILAIFLIPYLGKNLISAFKEKQNDETINLNKDPFSEIISVHNVKIINYQNKKYLFFPESMTFSRISELLKEKLKDSDNIAYRLPTFLEMKALYNENSEAGTGYYTNGKYYKAKMSAAFKEIGDAAWFWLGNTGGEYCINMYNGVFIDFNISSKSFPVHVLLISEK